MSDIIVNKVIKGDETYLDLTNDTVSEGTLLKNRTAHNSEGIQIQGVMEEGGGSVTGVKGDDESVYRDGDVNITAANIGTYTASQIDALLNNKVDVHGTDSLMTNVEHVKLAGIEAGAEENVIESISLNGEEITPVNKTVALSVIDKDVNDLTNYYKKSETDASLGAKQNIILSSTLSIGGQTVTEVEEALGSLANISKSMTGATSSAAGEGGFVPSPSAGDENKALFGDGTWKPVSGGGGGHTILDEDGTTYPQRSKLQFEGAIVSDDETNDATIVDIDPTLRDAEVIEGKNLFDFGVLTSQVVKGITITVVRDTNGNVLYIDLNGTASANTQIFLSPLTQNLFEEGDYVLSDPNAYLNEGSSPHTGAYIYILRRLGASGTNNYDVNPARVASKAYQFTVDYTEYNYFQVVLFVWNTTVLNHLKLYPMLCTLSEWQKSHDYEPYYIPVKDAMLRRSEQRVLGAKNLFNFDTPTLTNQGITFTNSGGIITANGTSGSSALPFIECRKTIPAGTYIATGCPVGGGNVVDPDNYQMVWRLNDGGGQILGVDYGNGFTFTLAQSAVVNVRCLTSKGMTVTNLTFKPMLRLASDPDDTYVPYAMTNRELTKRTIKSATFSVTTTASGNAPLYAGTDRCIMWIKCAGCLAVPYLDGGRINGRFSEVATPSFTPKANASLSGTYYYFDI